jgi:ubiquinone/menaquinone biosynthesis C-methylase UbiE
MSVWDLFVDNPGRPVHKWTHYFPAYERHLERLRNRTLTLIEIGCGGGGSLELWRRYLGPFARIVGVDVRPECSAFAGDQIEIRIGSQSDPVFLRSLVKELGTIDVIIDDGSHRMTDIRTSFEELYPAVALNGVYIVEDLHTAYWPDFEGGLRRPGTFIEIAKSLVDELHAKYTNEIAPTLFTRTTSSIHFYDSLIVFEKGSSPRHHASLYGRSG